ncbi:MAG: ABC transporter substrate-binding protein [Chloroflexi bacterium]|nr:ABC transporter substrate-binding protein [Chloroflexota bacterium]
MMKRVIVLLAVCAMLIVGSAGAQDGEPIKIGAVFDLSGATGDVGTPYANGVIAYVAALNESGGINGRPIELISADYAYSVETAEQLYAQFVAEGVVVFMGWGTGDTLALVSRIAEDEIPFISASYSASLNDPNGTAPYNFLIATTYGDQLEIMMMYMLEQWEAEGNSAADMRIAVFHHDSPFGTDPLAQGDEYAASAGIGGVLHIPMPRGATDFTAELQQADDFGVTHIIVQNVSSPAALLAQNAFDFFGGAGMVHFGCLNWCADELFVSRAGEAAEGVLGAIPFTPTTVEVEGQEGPRAFLEAQGQTLEEASLHFSQGWAAMDVMAEAIRRTLDAGLELTGPNIRATLETFEDYETGGLLAPVSFSPEDHRANRALKIYQVENGIWVAASDLIDLRAME